MKKSHRRILIFVAIGMLIGGAFVSKILVEKYQWKINLILYGKKYGNKVAEKQEFIYHSQNSVPKKSEPSSPDRPNVILISLDTLRAQSMSCYGGTKMTTPFLDRFAREGVLSENMCAASTTTPPSHMSMMTGLYRSVHGVLDKEVLDQSITTLPEALGAAGYATCAVTEDGFLVREMGFGRGFDDYYEIKDVLLFDKLHIAGGFAKDVFERGKTWIHEKSPQKFFLFLHTYEVHDPYFPPQPYDTMLLDNPDKYGEDLKKFRKHQGRADYGQFPRELIKDQYEGEIRYVDEIVKDFIAFIRQEDLTRKTLVIITSDHGEEFFEHHDIVGHGYHTYDTESHIPFIMWMPGKIPAGVRIQNQASNVDIVPTLAEFLHLEWKGSLQGESLLPLIRNPNYHDERLVFCEAVNQTCARTLLYKFIDTGELYVYDGDPEEAVNRADTHKELCHDAAERLHAFRVACQSLKAEKGLLKPSEMVRLNEEDIKKIKALGYLQ